MNKLQAFDNEKDPLERNRLLFSWLCDDQLRRELYGELQSEKFPVLRFKSLLRSKRDGEWMYEDVYFLSKKEDLETALKHYSVAPYQELDSGGKFMLGLDDKRLHGEQREAAEAAIGTPNNSTDKCPRHVASEKSEEREHLFTSEEIRKCARAAFRRAAVRPLNRAARGFGKTNHEERPVGSVPDGPSRQLNSHEFDLTIDVAEQAALHFLKLLFGFRDEAQPVLQRIALGAYERLVFQIIGRHFVAAADSNIPPLGQRQREHIKTLLRNEIEFAAHSKGDEPFREGAPKESAIKKLDRYPGLDREMLEVIVAGLIAGTVGNVRAAVPIVIYDFFNRKDDKGKPLIDAAREAALAGDEQKLEDLITKALRRNPPAAFLTRSSKPLKDAPALWFKDEQNVRRQIPEGAHLLLAMGADPAWEFVFGGDHSFKHNCVGKHLAWPLIVEVVRQVLQLPGLAQIIEPDSGKPRALVKRWGVICQLYELFYQRDRRLNQQPLYVVLPIKEPVKENADILWKLTQSGAHIVEAALKESGIVHFAWFMLVENGTHLALSTVFDGDFDAYVEHFAVKVPLFDKQFEFLDVEQRTPIRQHAKQFVENIRKYNRAPLGEYFFSAYPTVAVADVINATSDTLHQNPRTRRDPPPGPHDPDPDRFNVTASETAHSAVAKIRGVTSDKACGAVTPTPVSASTSDSL